MITDLLMRVLARLLPPLARARYLEEWRADLAGATDLALSRRCVVLGAVVLGAATLLVTIERDRPEHTGEPRGALPRRFARRGAALFAAAFAIVAVRWITGGGIAPEPGAASPAALAALDAAGRVVIVLAGVAGVAGAVLLVSAGLTARTRLAQISLVASVAGPAVLVARVVGWAESPLVTLTGFAVLLAGVVGGIVVIAGSPPITFEHREASRRQRLPVAAAGFGLLAAVVTLGAVDLVVWNPQAKVPGLELATIYGLMVERDGFDIRINLIAVSGWAVLWLAAGGLVATVACVGRMSPLTPRRLAIVLLGLVGAAVFFRSFAGFGVGMSLADTFAIGGGDGSLVSAILPYFGQFALAGAAVALGWAPRVVRGPVPAAS
ncbi:MAG: hypothetical protein JWM51_1398 [Microbacteriaceae bacterium]|nr:hypothetical protein [Microbacteriaceae bacterium]